MEVDILRGIDPRLFDERGNHAVVLVKAPCETVTAILSRMESMHPQIADPLAASVRVSSSEIEYLVFVFQLRGHTWTQIDGRDVYLLGVAEWLSKELKTMAFQYVFQDVTGGYGYSIYDSGQLVEEFSCVDLSGFGADVVEDVRQQALKRGGCVSSSGTVTFLTKRGTKLNVDSPEECGTVMERVATELGMYLAADVISTNGVNQVACWRRWKMSDLQAAKMLRALSEEEEYQRRKALDDVDEEAKLVLTPDPEAFERMQRMARGEIPAIVPPEFEALLKEWEEKLEQLKQQGGTSIEE